VVPTIGDDPRQSWKSVENWWVRPLYDALYPAAEKRQQVQQAPACPNFGNDSVLVRPPDLVVDEGDTVWPGLHCFGDPGDTKTEYGVTWWDPRALTLNVPQSFGLRQGELLKEPDDAAAVDNDLKAYKAWRAGMDEVRKNGAMPSVMFRTVTEESRREDLGTAGARVELIELPSDPARPTGARFGALVHATLATVPLDAAPDGIQQLASLNARVLGANDTETDAAVIAVQNALLHPILQRAREAWRVGHCRRETPVTLTQADGTVIEGVLDLAFLESDTWMVVDFKTDRELEAALEHYRKQVALYAAAVARTTQLNAVPILMRV
jgi:hypothetical protein